MDATMVVMESSSSSDRVVVVSFVSTSTNRNDNKKVIVGGEESQQQQQCHDHDSDPNNQERIRQHRIQQQFQQGRRRTIIIIKQQQQQPNFCHDHDPFYYSSLASSCTTTTTTTTKTKTTTTTKMFHYHPYFLFRFILMIVKKMSICCMLMMILIPMIQQLQSQSQDSSSTTSTFLFSGVVVPVVNAFVVVPKPVLLGRRISYNPIDDLPRMMYQQKWDRTTTVPFPNMHDKKTKTNTMLYLSSIQLLQRQNNKKKQQQQQQNKMKNKFGKSRLYNHNNNNDNNNDVNNNENKKNDKDDFVFSTITTPPLPPVPTTSTTTRTISSNHDSQPQPQQQQQQQQEDTIVVSSLGLATVVTNSSTLHDPTMMMNTNSSTVPILSTEQQQQLGYYNNDWMELFHKNTNYLFSSTTSSSASLSSSSVSSSSSTSLSSKIPWTPDLIAIVTIYFVEGGLGLVRFAKMFLLKDELHCSPVELTMISGFLTLPWTIKPIYGFISDTIPLFGYYRKSYLIVAGILGTISYGIIGYEPLWNDESILDQQTKILGTIFALLMGSACIAFSDVVADGIIVTKTRESYEKEEKLQIQQELEQMNNINTNALVVMNGDTNVPHDDTTTITTQTATTSNNNNLGATLQSLCWGAASLGAILSAYYSGSLLEMMSSRSIFTLTAFLPLVVAIVSFGITEQPITPQKTTTATTDEKNEKNINNIDPTMNIIRDMDTSLPTLTSVTTDVSAVTVPVSDISIPTTTATTTTILSTSTIAAIDEPVSSSSFLSTVQNQTSVLLGAFRNPALWQPTLFLFLWQSTPTSEGAFFYYVTNELQIGPEFLGSVQFASAIASLVGVVIYNQYLKNIPIKSILLWSTLLSFPLGVIPPVLLITHLNREWGIPDTALIYGDDVVLAALGQISFLPTLVLATRLCPPGIEAVLFATLMSIYNGAGTLGTEIGAVLTQIAGITATNFDNLIPLTVFCNVSSLWPLLLINWLDENNNKKKADDDNDNTDTTSTTRTTDSTNNNNDFAERERQ